MLDLARSQKAAVEAGDIEEASALAVRRQQVLAAIQKIDAAGGDGKPSAPASLIREILALDAEAEKATKARMEEVSVKLNKINTFRVVCRAAVDGARPRRHLSNP
jgi:hypothetical protein